MDAITLVLALFILALKIHYGKMKTAPSGAVFFLPMLPHRPIAVIAR
jgi:hypothetical protein